jgi:hypothetical protein
MTSRGEALGVLEAVLDGGALTAGAAAFCRASERCSGVSGGRPQVFVLRRAGICISTRRGSVVDSSAAHPSGQHPYAVGVTRAAASASACTDGPPEEPGCDTFGSTCGRAAPKTARGRPGWPPAHRAPGRGAGAAPRRGRCRGRARHPRRSRRRRARRGPSRLVTAPGVVGSAPATTAPATEPCASAGVLDLTAPRGSTSARGRRPRARWPGRGRSPGAATRSRGRGSR